MDFHQETISNGWPCLEASLELLDFLFNSLFFRLFLQCQIFRLFEGEVLKFLRDNCQVTSYLFHDLSLEVEGRATDSSTSTTTSTVSVYHASNLSPKATLIKFNQMREILFSFDEWSQSILQGQ